VRKISLPSEVTALGKRFTQFSRKAGINYEILDEKIFLE
jgi:hypothetical protein